MHFQKFFDKEKHFQTSRHRPSIKKRQNDDNSTVHCSQIDIKTVRRFY